MKFRSINQSTILAWSPLIVFVLYIAVSLVLQKYLPDLFCSQMNESGKEMVCGFQYSAQIISVLQITFCALYFGGVVLSVQNALGGKLDRIGKVGFALSLLLVFSYFLLAMNFSSEHTV